MQKIQDYTIVEKITETRSSIIYRGHKDTSDDTVIIKALKTKNPTPSEIARFRQEYKLIKGLDIEGVIKILDLIEHIDILALVLEDFDSVSIKSLLEDKKKFELKSFLSIAIKIAQALGSLHEKQIVHRDIKPHNILINTKTGMVKITDFGISSEITHENEGIYNPDVIEGSLAYMSPEQTGRMNRTVDYRTDIYSLGITFYEMLTGTLPFISKDPMAIIHSHIAVKPASPKQHNNKIPQVVSDIVEKLLSKNMEDRYQNSFGLMADLKECLKQIAENYKIESFVPGRFDISNKFIVPQKLVGREKEIDTLISGFEKLYNDSGAGVEAKDHGGVKIVLVTGHSGIGKSALINEIHKPIVARRGYFISGKYEQFRRDRPYSAIIQAFQGLVKQILSESNEKINIWKEKLLQALGPNGKVITDIIPEVELITGAQPKLAELGPEETKNRFKYTFEKFVSVFPTIEHPVALFLDDLQWADIPSMQFIHEITTSLDINYFYLIGSYRDNEVDETHPLTDALKVIGKAGVEINRISLGPILENDIKNIILNLLKCDDKQGALLAGLVNKKTGGNPFFVNQFLETLYNEKLIKLEIKHGWKWDVEQITGLQVTDNVVELLAGKIDKLPDSVSEVLTICAAIGNRFDLETLSYILGKSIDEVLEHLTAAINEGFVNFSSEKGLYIFQHDRIQEAAYSLVPDSQKEALHYRIGKKALERAHAENDLEEKLFYIVDQLTSGSRLMTDKKELEEFTVLNLKAGKKAKASAAYKAASMYLEKCLNLVGDDGWQNQYNFMLDIYLESVETAYFNQNYERMNELINTAVDKSVDVIEKSKFLLFRMMEHHSKQEFVQAIAVGRYTLKLLGRKPPVKAGKIDFLLVFIKIKIALHGRQPEDLINMPVNTNPKEIASGPVSSQMNQSLWYHDTKLFGIAMCYYVLDIIKKGLLIEAPLSFIAFSSVLIAGLSDIEGATKYCKLAIDLMKKMDVDKYRTVSMFYYNMNVRHWTEHLKGTLESFKEAYQTGIESGDVINAAVSLMYYDLNFFRLCDNLITLDEEFEKHSKILHKLNLPNAIIFQLMVRQVVKKYIDAEEDLNQLPGKILQYTEEAIISLNSKPFLAAFYNYQLHLRIYFGHYKEALEDIEKAYSCIETIATSSAFPYFLLNDSITRLNLYNEAGKKEKKKFLKIVKKNQKRLKHFSNHAPMNNLHNYLLVEAELARVRGDNVYAEETYDKAIQLSIENEFIQTEAIANELAGKFHQSTGNVEKAKEYITAAYNTNTRYGALNKLKQLRELYPELLEIPKETKTFDMSSTISGTMTGFSTFSESLDLSTVVKASQTISGEIDLNRLLTNIMKLSIENAGAQSGSLILENEKNKKLYIEVSGKEDGTILITEPVHIDSEPEIAASVINYAYKTGENIVIHDASIDERFSSDPYIIKKNPKSILCSPIRHKGKMTGILYLENNLSTGAFTPDRIELLHILSSQAAISIENSRLIVSRENEAKLRTEMNIAADIQRVLLPDDPKIEGFEITPYMKPADDVGGDYYDVINTDKKDWVVIGDVSGHGVPAGLIMMMVQTAIQTVVRKYPDMRPSEMLNAVNETVKYNIGKMKNDKYMTITVFSFEKDGNALYSGLHQNLIIYRASTDEVEEVPSAGIWLSAWDMGQKNVDSNLKLNSGDILFLYTDGITEAKDKNKKMFSEERLVKLIKETSLQSTEKMRDRVLEELKEYRTDDDVTMLILKKV